MPRRAILVVLDSVGAGELRVNRAVALSSAAWDTQALSAALSFGAVEADKQVILKVQKRLLLKVISL